MESTEESVQEYTEPDGTKVIKRTIITRIRPSGNKSGSSSSHLLSNSGRLGTASSPSRTSTLDYADPKTLNEFEKAFLNKHNEYRKLHGVPPLKMSKEVKYFPSKIVANVSPFENAALHLRPRVGSQHC